MHQMFRSVTKLLVHFFHRQVSMAIPHGKANDQILGEWLALQLSVFHVTPKSLYEPAEILFWDGGVAPPAASSKENNAHDRRKLVFRLVVFTPIQKIVECLFTVIAVHRKPELDFNRHNLLRSRFRTSRSNSK